MTRTHEKIAAFVFGIVFVICILIIALFVPEPSTFQLFVFRVVLALAGGGVAAMIPGFIHVELSGVIRTGGALAVFAILYFLNPAQLIASTNPGPLPIGSPREIAENYLRVADKLDSGAAWIELSVAAKSQYSQLDFVEAFETVRSPLGNIEVRKFVGGQSTAHVPGWPNAHYRTFQYKTEFERGASRYEFVTVMSENNKWQVAGYTIHP